MNKEQGKLMRRLLTPLPCALFCSFFPLPCSLRAESPPHVEQVHVGLPGGQGEQESARSRNGAWAPVYVKLKAGPEGSGRDRFRIRVETTDSENTAYHYDTGLPALAPNQDYLAVAYIRPGGAGSDFTVQLQTASGQSVQGVPPVTREADKETLEPKDVLYLSVGARLPGMKRALLADPALAKVADEDLTDRKGTVRFAYMDDVPQMPDRWFGYEAADVVVLATGSQTFITSLNDDAAAPQRKALAEWVRRGGKLIVSVGTNRQLAAEVLDKMPLPDFDKMPLLHCGIEGSAAAPDAANLARWLAGDGHVPSLRNVEITRLTPGEGVSVLVGESAKVGDKTQECPVVVEAPCGLGRVWLTAFDVDGPPFTTWPEGQKAFWARVESEFTPKAAAGVHNQPGQPVPPGMNGPAMGDGLPAEQPYLLGEVQRALENFEKVPVVNFGWVALFILVYIVIVGPLDYFLLKRVFKRLELTWITFPAVVLVVSAAAYCTAYYLKGDDLRINKIDIVEYDLGSPQQAYGTSWFTLFSPRIQNYTVGLEPAAPGWAAPPPADAASHAVTVAALSNPDLAERVGSSSLFRQPYAYAEDASGLERVPIPVWSTRSFQASWRAGIDPAKPPVAADLHHARDENDLRPKLAGTVTNGLPVALQGVTLFYRGLWYTLPNDLGPGDSFDVDSLFAAGKVGRPASQWVGDPRTLAPSLAGPAGLPAAPNDNNGFNNFNGQPYMPAKRSYELVKDLMFHAKAEGSQMLNSSLRPLDESWRLDAEKTASGKPVYRDEVVLVARTPTLSDKSQAVAAGPGSATRLWLDRLPDGKSAPPALTGYLTQETYVRAYIPVKPN